MIAAGGWVLGGIDGLSGSVSCIVIALWLWAGWRSLRNPFVSIVWLAATVFFFAISCPRTGPRERGRTTICLNNLKNLGAALLAYEQRRAALPPVHTLDAAHKPLTSWRTLILPQIERLNEYSQYRQDEPWNSPANQNITAMPIELFRCPSDDSTYDEQNRNNTSYVAIVAPGSAWQPGHALKLSEIKDNPADTLLLVEMKNSGIKWAEPRDLDLENLPPGITKENLLKQISNHPGGINALFADGHVEFIPDTISWPQFEALLTIAGGEPINRDTW